MRIAVALALAASLTLVPAVARADDKPIPTPKLNRVDYRRPDAQKGLSDELGFGKRSQSILRQLQPKDGQARTALSGIIRWVDRNLKPDPVMAGRWRGVDQIVKDGTQGGLADRAVVIGAFARASGIPVVWVKTISRTWLIDAKRGTAKRADVNSHIFLEVHLDGRWQLLDPATATLYESYDPQTRSLPGDQFVYDKGGDPVALVLPHQPERWQAQLARYVASVPLGSLPWAVQRDMLGPWRVYIAGKRGPATYAKATAKAFGFKVEKSFNTGWERVLPEVRGKILIVVMYDGKPSLPEAYWKTFLPPGYEAIVSGQKKLPKGWVAHKLTDGTRVILVTATEYGPVELAVSEALEG